MTPLWVLRHDGEMIACAVSRPEIIDGVAYDDGAHFTLDSWHSPVKPELRMLINANPDATRYEYRNLLLALEPHPTPGET